MEWGTELWDKYNELCSHTSLSIDFLDNCVANFIKERGKIEFEYAKNLRGLVKKFAPKETAAKSGSGGATSAIQLSHDEEYTHVMAFKQMLDEVGFMAGQHEVLAENFSKDIYKQLHDIAKQLKDRRRRCMKNYDKLSDELRKSFKNLEVTREKFSKAFDEWDKANVAFDKASMDGSVPPNELSKLKLHAFTKNSHSDSMKCQFASQLVKTNDFQARYYYELLPDVLNQLQDVERCRINSMKEGFIKCVEKEYQVAPILANCLAAIKSAMDAIRPEEDTEIVIERYKSGDVPPGNFNFEDMRDPQTMLLRSDTFADNRPTNLNLYPKKRELERQISSVQKELVKCHKEMNSFQKMEATYNSNPKFGNSNQLRGEMDQVKRKTSDLEKMLAELRSKLAAVEERLSSIRSNRGNNLSFRSSSDSLTRGSSHRSGSSSGSSGNNNLSGNYHIPENNYASNQELDSAEWVEDDFYEIPPPPPPLPENATGNLEESPLICTPSVISSCSDSSGQSIQRCCALYDYTDLSSMQECNLPISEGEELILIEGDCDGWTKVRRATTQPNQMNEGYVPSSYIKYL